MAIYNGITVSFTYSELDKKRYQAAGKAFHNYKFKAELKAERKSQGIGSYRRKCRRDAIIKFLIVLFFMFYQVVLLSKSFGTYMAEEDQYAELGNRLADVSNTVGFVCTIITILLIAFFSISKNNAFGCGFFDVIGEMIKSFFKAVLVWIILFLLLGVFSYFFPKGSFLYKKLDEKLQFFNEIQFDGDLVNQEEESIEVQEIEQELNSSNINNNQMMQSEMQYINCTFEITVEVAKIYIYPTDYGHMYEASKGSQFVATGNEFVAEDGALWYEFYINSERNATAWVKAMEIQFL